MLNKRNLKLGYGGTKTEMARLISDASKMSKEMSELGVSVDANSMSFGNIVNAISVMQKHLDIAGTTALEAEETISGSVNSMKASWQNLLTGLADNKADMGKLVKEFSGTLITAIKNVSPKIIEIIKNLAKALPDVFVSLLPDLISLVEEIFNGIVDAIIKNSPIIINSIIDLLKTMISLIVQNLPMFLNAGLKIILSLADGLIKSLPKMIPNVVNIITKIITTIIDNLPSILSSGIDILLALIDGIISAIPQLIEAMPEIITSIVLALTDPNMLIKIISVGPRLIASLIKGIIQAIPELIALVPMIILKLFQGFKDKIKNTNWLELGKNILKGILNGMLDFGTIVKDAIKKVGNKITNAIKEFFGIHSPSKLMEDEIGKFLPLGIAEGFEDEIPNTINQVENAMSKLNKGIQTSINPTINPQANTNPLVIQIENFNNERETDIQALAEELEFYRKNSSLVVGGK